MSATPTTREVLVKARELIATPERWTKEVSAKDAAGKEVSVHSSSASCFCMTGAVDFVAKRAGVYANAYYYLKMANGIRGNVWHWNDAPKRTHAEVLEAFDRAIALASTEASDAR